MNEAFVPQGTNATAAADALQQALDAIRARDDFIAIAAHELRSPMNALALRLAAVERMARQGRDPELATEIGRIGRTVERYVRRATVLLDVSRLNAGHVQLARVPVRLGDLVQTVVDAHRDEAAFRGASLHAQLDQQDLVGHWDPHMAEEILSNLVSNAIKYGQGTPVHVRVGAMEPGLAVLEVRDGGPGIDETQRRRIFEKFERVVSSSAYQSGFGLGLWIVGRMVTAHKGTLAVAAPPGGGTVFTVTLPLDPHGSGNKEQECR